MEAQAHKGRQRRRRRRRPAPEATATATLPEAAAEATAATNSPYRLVWNARTKRLTIKPRNDDVNNNATATDHYEQEQSLVFAAHELAESLSNAANVLVDRLFDYCLRQEQQQQQQPPRSSSSSSGSTAASATGSGLTLPASAIAWLATQLWCDADTTRTTRNDDDDDDTTPTCCSGWCSCPQEDDEAAAYHHDAHIAAAAALSMGEAMQRRLATLQPLLQSGRITHLRITSDTWPPCLDSPSYPQRQNQPEQNVDDDNPLVGHEIKIGGRSRADDDDGDAMSVQSQLTMEEYEQHDHDEIDNEQPQRQRQRSIQDDCYCFLWHYHQLQQRPRVDLGVVFGNHANNNNHHLKVLLLDQVPPEWIVMIPNRKKASCDSLELLNVQRASVYNVTDALFGLRQWRHLCYRQHDHHANCCNNNNNNKVNDTSRTQWPVHGKLTHLKLSHCAIGELSGLCGSRHDGQEQRMDMQEQTQVPVEQQQGSSTSGTDADDNNALLASTSAAATTTTPTNSNQDILRQQLQQQQPHHLPPPLSRLPNLVSLSLSHNEIRLPETALAGLSSLTRLKRLDLSFNQLTTMRGAHRMLGNVKELILTGNRIRTTRGGLDRLYSLESLSLDRNQLVDLASVAGLAKLPELKSLKLAGNPLADSAPRRYRVEVFNLFRQERLPLSSSHYDATTTTTYRQLLEELPILDGMPASKTELVGLRGLAFSSLMHYPPSSTSGLAVSEGAAVLSQHQEQDMSRYATSTSLEIENNESRGEQHLRSIVPSSSFGVTGRPRRVSRRGKARRIVIAQGPLPRSHVDSDCCSNQEIVKRQTYPSGNSDITKNVQFSMTDLVAALPRLASSFCENDKGTVQANEGGSSVEQNNNATCSNESAHHAIGSRAPSLDDTNAERLEKPSLQEVLPDEAKGLSFISLSPVLKHDARMQAKRTASDTETSVAASTGEDLESQTNPQSPSHRCQGEEPTIGDVDDDGMNCNTPKEDYPASQNEEKSVTPSTDEPCASFKRENAGPPTETVQFQTQFQLMECPDISSTDIDLSERADHYETMLPHVPEDVFPDYVWEEDENSVLSSIKTNAPVEAASQSKYQEAEEESLYDGLDHLKGLPVLTNLELYFRCFVFRVSPVDRQSYQDEPSDKEKLKRMLDLAPRIQLRPVDWRALESTTRALSTVEFYSMTERFDGVWREEALGCGKLAAKRIPPHRKPKRGFHGDVLFTNGKLAKTCECRKLIVCTSDAAIYLISDFDAVSRHQLSKAGRRRFPMPIPEESLFQNAPWPHALARHRILMLERITIGFGFQRLSLHFRAERDGSGEERSEDFTYVLITCNKLRTVNLLQHFQSLSKDYASRPSNQSAARDLKIDNDDKQVLDALAEAVAPSAVGMVLHYQIVQQRWQHGDRGTVRRACIVTDTHLYLLDEDYVGDGSESFEGGARTLGEVCFKVVDDSPIEQVSEVQAGLDDPNSVTVVIKPLSRLQRYHRWRLVCRDREGAERLVEDIRKAMPEESFA